MRRQAGPGRGTDRIRTDVELRRGHDISAPRRVLRRVAQEYQPPAVLRQAGTGVRPSAPAPALLSGGDGRTAVIEIARDDPAATGQGDQCRTGGRGRREGDGDPARRPPLLGSPEPDAPSDDTVRAALRQLIDRAGCRGSRAARGWRSGRHVRRPPHLPRCLARESAGRRRGRPLGPEGSFSGRFSPIGSSQRPAEGKADLRPGREAVHRHSSLLPVGSGT